MRLQRLIFFGKKSKEIINFVKNSKSCEFRLSANRYE
jgi:hypothetical protein